MGSTSSRRGDAVESSRSGTGRRGSRESPSSTRYGSGVSSGWRSAFREERVLMLSGRTRGESKKRAWNVPGKDTDGHGRIGTNADEQGQKGNRSLRGPARRACGQNFPAPLVKSLNQRLWHRQAVPLGVVDADDAEGLQGGAVLDRLGEGADAHHL